jgi:hypothetical protein
VFFSSGWEWGYWLNDVVAARASWDPLLNQPDSDAFKMLLTSVFQNFGEIRQPLVELINETASAQAAWLIRGGNHGNEPFLPALTGQAYLQGEDTLDDLARLVSGVPKISLTATQPSRTPLFYGQSDTAENLRRISALLAEMDTRLRSIADRFARLESNSRREIHRNLRELQLSSRITALRAGQMHDLFLYKVASKSANSRTLMPFYAAMSRRAIRAANAVVSQAELLYRLDPERIAGWKRNPTAYRFGYLWSVRHLFYFERDHHRLVGGEKNVCFGNVIDPFEVSFGLSADAPLFAPLRRVLDLIFEDGVFDRCLNISETWHHHSLPNVP